MVSLRDRWMMIEGRKFYPFRALEMDIDGREKRISDLKNKLENGNEEEIQEEEMQDCLILETDIRNKEGV